MNHIQKFSPNTELVHEHRIECNAKAGFVGLFAVLLVVCFVGLLARLINCCLARFPEQHRDLAQVEINEMLCLVRHIRTYTDTHTDTESEG